MAARADCTASSAPPQQLITKVSSVCTKHAALLSRQHIDINCIAAY